MNNQPFPQMCSDNIAQESGHNTLFKYREGAFLCRTWLTTRLLISQLTNKYKRRYNRRYFVEVRLTVIVLSIHVGLLGRLAVELVFIVDVTSLLLDAKTVIFKKRGKEDKARERREELRDVKI